MIADDFKRALSCWASGVSVVAAHHTGQLYGLTVSSFSAISLEPALVGVAIGRQSPLCAHLEASEAFSVSILERAQEPLSNHFAASGRRPAAPDPTIWRRSAAGQWVLRGAAATVDCTLYQAYDAGDHRLYLGEVRQAEGTPDAAPLLYFRRAYRTVTG